MDLSTLQSGNKHKSILECKLMDLCIVVLMAMGGGVAIHFFGRFLVRDWIVTIPAGAGPEPEPGCSQHAIVESNGQRVHSAWLVALETGMGLLAKRCWVEPGCSARDPRRKYPPLPPPPHTHAPPHTHTHFWGASIRLLSPDRSVSQTACKLCAVKLYVCSPA